MKLLFFTGLDHHVRRLEPLVVEAEERGHEVCLVTAQNPYCGHLADFELGLRRLERPYRILSDYREDDRFAPELFARRRDLYAALRRAYEAGAPPPWFAAGTALDFGIAETAEEAAAMSVALQVERPDAVVLLHEGNFWTRIFTSVAMNAGTPVYSFQEGLYYDILRDGLLIEYARQSRRVFVWGERDRRRTIQAGAEPERLLAVGTPHLDPIVRNWPTREAARERLGLDPERPLVLLVPPNGIVAQLGEAFLRGVADWMRRHPHIQFATKWRVVEDGAHRPRTDAFFRAQLGDQYRVFAAEDPYEVVAAADVALATATTLGSEAIALGVPLLEITWGQGDAEAVIDWGRICSTEKIAGPADLEHIGRYLEEGPPEDAIEGARRFRDDAFAGLTGRATADVLDHIEQDAPQLRSAATA